MNKLVNLLLIVSFILLNNNSSHAKSRTIFIDIKNCNNNTIMSIKNLSKNLILSGYNVPNKFNCSKEYVKKLYGDSWSDTIVGSYNVVSQTVYINEDNLSYEAAILHEIGHYNYFLKNNKEFILEQYKKEIPLNLVNIIKEEVSEYATTDRLEFVAEVFAQKQSGIKFSKEINDFYKECGGI
jgi:hypothetical protein